MSQAVNHLVGEYLTEEYPTVAKAFQKEAPSTSALGRSPFGSKTLAEIVLAYRTQKSAPAVADSSSDDDDAPIKKPVAKKASPKASPKQAPKKAPIPDSSSDDDEPVRKPASRKASPKPVAKKAPVADPSSDDDAPIKKPVAKKASPKASPKQAPKKAPIADSSSDDDAPFKKAAVKRVSPKASPKVAAKRAAMDSDSEDDDGAVVPVKKAPKTDAAPPRRGPHNLNDDGTYRRFQRIDPTTVTFHADALRDNRPGDEHLTLRQNQEMMRTKGKGFNKLKQKNKGKFYGAGVDLSVRAYQFPDSDDE